MAEKRHDGEKTQNRNPSNEAISQVSGRPNYLLEAPALRISALVLNVTPQNCMHDPREANRFS
jgi:hypothetical protein